MNLYEKIINLLKQNNIDYQEFRHEPVRTSEEAAQVRGSNLSEGAKALIFKCTTSSTLESADLNTKIDSQYEFIQLIVPGNHLVDKDKFKDSYKFTKLKMASPEEVLEISGVEPGGVPPFGNLFNIPIKVFYSSTQSFDELLKSTNMMEFNCGDRSISVRMKVSDYIKIVKPQIGSFSLAKT